MKCSTLRLAISLFLISAPAVTSAQLRAPWPPPETPGSSGPLMTPPAGKRDVPAGPSEVPDTPVRVVPSNRPIPSDYVIGPGDVLDVVAWQLPNVSRTTTVRPDGKISLPLVQDVQAAGLTAMQLRDKIATVLAEYRANADVSVAVIDVHSMRVSILGGVRRPGVLELRGVTTMLDAIASAGGFRDDVAPKNITILRKNASGGTDRLRFNYKRVLANRTDAPDVVLKSGDIIVVPRYP